MRSTGASLDDTIVALASPPGPAERAILRLSGPACRRIADELLQVELGGRGSFGARLDVPAPGQPCLCLWMPGPASYTGDDVLELHIWGSLPLIEAALEALYRAGARPAGPGEFTRRALLNGRIDLDRAQGVARLVAAGDEAERRAAAALFAGGVGARADRLRESLETLAARLEASLDFEEDDAGHVPAGEFDALFHAAALALAEARQGALARAEGGRPRVGLLGLPNAGKSSLFNRLSGSPRALVADLPGTTRDVLRAALDLGGARCWLLDLPGLEALGPNLGERLGEHAELALALERRAQSEALAQRGGLDLELWLVSAAGRWPERALVQAGRAPRLLVWTQIDRAGVVQAPPPALLSELGQPEWVALSVHSGVGLELLETRLGELLIGPRGGLESPAAELNQIQASALERLEGALREAREGLDQGLSLDLVAERLRSALEALGGVRGRTLPEDLLDRIFARFCLGK